ncbi:MAG: hypothetical protein A3E78_11910 [Alphaproteobacteria bacterium RIFCSPHIGHO2_12_FULL_63_12]|nr:MAG: hypothetical protein A3E78_11910 [Alphaproteobacteria bacterium RIFCSPHIGHO2_12_FULL_63_12]
MSEAKQIKIRPIKKTMLGVRIVGITPLIHHQFSAKAREQMRRKKEGSKTKTREALNAQAEFEAASYFLSDGSPAIPVSQIKNAMCSAAHKDLGFEKKLVRSGIFVHADEGFLCRLDTPGSKMREDVVRVGMGSADLRYRPCYEEWGVDLRIEFDADQVSPEDIVNLLERAGFGVGCGEWRPEKDGEFGRFRVDRDQQIRVSS